MDESGQAAELIVKIVEEIERRRILFILQNDGAEKTISYLQELLGEAQ